MKPLRIAIYTPSFLPKIGGAEIFHHNLATRLVQAGHRVTVIAPRPQVAAFRKKQWTVPYHLQPHPTRPWRWLHKHPFLGRLLCRRTLSALQKCHEFDVWHVVNTFPTGYAVLDWAAECQGSPVPFLIRPVGDDVLPTTNAAAQRDDQDITKLWLNRLKEAPCVISLSNQMSEELQSLGVTKIAEIPNAVDLERFSSDEHQALRNELRQQWQATPKTVVLLCVARHHPQKNLPHLLRVLSHLKKHDVQLILAGRDTEHLRPMADELGLAKLVRFTQIVAEDIPVFPPDELIALYNAADIFVLPSLLEGFSTALLEAAAAGLPLVAGDGPGPQDFLDHGQHGLLIDPTDEQAWIDALQELILSAENRSEWSKKSRRRAKQYSWSRTVKAYEAIYQQLVTPIPQEPH